MRKLAGGLVWALILAAVVVLALRVDSIDVDFGQYGVADLAYLALFSVFFVLLTGLRAWRFGFLIRRQFNLEYRVFLVNFPWLFLVGAMTPFRTGEGLRAVWIKGYGGSAGEALGNLVVERMADIAILLLLAVLGGLLAPFATEFDTVTLAIILVALALGGGLAAVIIGRTGLLERRPFNRLKLQSLLRGLSVLNGLSEILVFSALTLAIWFGTVLSFFVALNGLLGEVSWGAAMLCVAAINLARLISPAPGNIGSYQAAVIGALGAYGVGVDSALEVGIMLNATMLVTMIVQGVLGRFLSRFSWLGKSSRFDVKPLL